MKDKNVQNTWILKTYKKWMFKKKIIKNKWIVIINFIIDKQKFYYLQFLITFL